MGMKLVFAGIRWQRITYNFHLYLDSRWLTLARSTEPLAGIFVATYLQSLPKSLRERQRSTNRVAPPQQCNTAEFIE